MAKSYCPCNTCQNGDCEDCPTCDICYAQTHCVDDIPDDYTLEKLGAYSDD
jgi:hypothetical protein